MMERSPRATVVACAASLAVEATGVQLAGVAFFDHAGRLRMDAAAGHRTQAWAELNVTSASTAHRVRRSGRLLTLRNYATDSGCAPWLIDMFCRGEGCGALATVPLWQGEDVTGVLYGGMRTTAQIGDRTLRSLERVAQIVSVAIFATEQAGRVTPHPLTAIENSNPTPQLSYREEEMLTFLAQGLSTRAIAEATQLTTNSVRTYIQCALSKLDANSRLQAVATARRLGLIG